ncbi:hypothetical protein TNIN_456571 [Trichonephila inaurata madagascariensis]|uniref:Uncharacterized protein n=1 Tax=Trichonephila inaurata madagascariensis TaxID=2747483 RepID=A0A8X6MA38_9ARAC|nr:hypothetical protein TNIN_456571 [Trichonephila inaurata madagascariensis]
MPSVSSRNGQGELRLHQEHEPGGGDKNFVKKGEEQKDLNILSACSDIELRFTGWGMFVVDKTLFLTTTGVLVTYGVLFATEASKIPY